MTAFVCGPEIMMRLTAQARAARGIADVWHTLPRPGRARRLWRDLPRVRVRVLRLLRPVSARTRGR